MRTLSDEGLRTLTDIASRHGVSLDAVEHLLMAVMAGHGNQAQFNHPDLGGMGQWSQGGMTMVGDMFNHGLKARVDTLCTELSGLVRNMDLLMPMAASSQSQSQGNGQYQNGQYQNTQFQGSFQGHSSPGQQSQGHGASLFVPGAFTQGNWWPDDLGHAASTGAQNNLRYAFFPASRRLAIDVNGQVTVYDTKDHQIGGFSQQQSGDQSLSFTSQYGLVRVSDLAVVSPTGETAPTPTAAAPVVESVHETPTVPAPPETPAMMPVSTPSAAVLSSDDDIFNKIERLAGLHAKGILTDSEFETKKAELLARL
ncbi:SHOCT domain-containing protein [Rhizobium sp. CG5]|uniref:SHOCT domain-containing protein n=1 Tax=Rhizobium sp. CG5 TaxID=2726076 RepID=UPI00203392E6|nr:SHOCT domain-containing protein [Rhizobium sp. CG5]MCM2475813.1 SHOCT domain-containing protein [Rhizobium sp. CG5]